MIPSLIIIQLLKDTPKLKNVFLCLDNDEAGQAANERISDKLRTHEIKTEILVPIRKDWNEDLLYPPNETEEEVCVQAM